MSDKPQAALAPQKQARSVKERLRHRQEATKRVIVNVGTQSDPQESAWEVKMLTEDDLDHVKQRATRKVRNSALPDVDEKLMRRLILKAGISAGPQNWDDAGAWKGTEENLDDLLQDYALSNELYEAVNEAHSLDDETRRGFR